MAPAAAYSRVVNVAPSMSGDSANGPGLSETKTTVRGFSDDQYNITIDGIPWGDTNNPAHHSSCSKFCTGVALGLTSNETRAVQPTALVTLQKYDNCGAQALTV